MSKHSIKAQRWMSPLSGWYEPLLVACIIVLYSILILRRLGDTSLGYPDADRILMDGAFFRDFFVDLPLLDIYGYVTSYFGQYPALSIGYRPPVFPAVEGVFNLLLGVNMWSSRLSLLAFGVAGVLALYATVRQVYGQSAALAAAALYATAPFVVKLGWYTMAEIPVVSVALVTAFFYQRYIATGSTGALWGTVLAAVVAVWTKQTAVFLALWLIIHQIGAGGFVRQLRQRRVWLATVVGIILLVPLLVITLWLGDQNLAQSIGLLLLGIENAYAGLADSLPYRLQPDRLLLRLRQLYEVHLEAPTLVLSVLGLLWALLRRDGRVWFWLSLIIAVYLFFTYLRGENSRYPVFWIPAFAVLASVPLSYLRGRSARGFRLYAGALLVACGWQVWAIYQSNPKYATGYEAAAAYVLAKSASPTVFFDGYNNGYFVYFMRALDEERSMYVLRGDKLLSSTAIAGRNRLEVHAEGVDDILDIFDRYGPQYIVVEDKNTIGIPVHGKLRNLLRERTRFRLVEAIPVDTGSPSTREPLEGVTLLIYEDMERKVPSEGILELRLPVVGQTLRIPFRPVGERVSE
jgi:hypothetical protein